MNNQEKITTQEYRNKLAQKLKHHRRQWDDWKKLAEALLAKAQESEQYKESKIVHDLRRKQAIQKAANTKQHLEINKQKKKEKSWKEITRKNQEKYPMSIEIGINKRPGEFHDQVIVARRSLTLNEKYRSRWIEPPINFDNERDKRVWILQVWSDWNEHFFCDYSWSSNLADITLEDAMTHIENSHKEYQVQKLINDITKYRWRPIQLWVANNIPVMLTTGIYGPYIKCGNATLSCNKTDVNMMELFSQSPSKRKNTKRKIVQAFITMFPQGAWDCDQFINKLEAFKNHYVCIKSTDKGYWIHLTNKSENWLKKTVRYKLPKEYQSIEQVKLLTLENCLTIIEAKRKKRQQK